MRKSGGIITGMAAVAVVLGLVSFTGLSPSPGIGTGSLVGIANRPAADSQPNQPGAGVHDSTPSVGIGGNLQTAIDRVISDNAGYRIGVALVDTTDNAVHEYGSAEPFVAASTAKVLAAIAYLHKVESGQASLADPMDDYNSGYELQEMIQDSDNNAWASVLDAIGPEELQAYSAQTLGIDYSMDENVLTAADMARTLAGLFEGRLVDAENTSLLLSYMRDTNFESLIPAAVPAGIQVFHKYGMLGGELHDAAILNKDGKSFVLVLYTELKDPGSSSGDVELPDLTYDAQTAIIHQLTQAVTGAVYGV
ncbi:serine hydrolase [Pseudarthrobacter sp. N5]|uniref:serine hydrolase n=1 Tax=Pseudarthrobacter sp. N5 TaxID=3418416 RepID=UPI003CF28004